MASVKAHFSIICERLNGQRRRSDVGPVRRPRVEVDDSWVFKCRSGKRLSVNRRVKYRIATMDATHLASRRRRGQKGRSWCHVMFHDTDEELKHSSLYPRGHTFESMRIGKIASMYK